MEAAFPGTFALNSNDQSLRQAADDCRRYDLLVAQKASQTRQLASARLTQKHSSRRLHQQLAKVRKLETFSFASLFATLLGRKKQRLQSERERCRAAEERLAEVDQKIATLKDGLSQLGNRIGELSDAPKAYRRWLERKETQLRQTHPAATLELNRIEEMIEQRLLNERELTQAIEAGQSALRAVDDVHQALRSAAGWGAFDLLGGGALVTLAKHSKIDDAKVRVERMQRDLKRFGSELDDVGERLRGSLQIDGMSKFADYFFDGFIADSMVQSRISQAQRSCDRVHAKVLSALDQSKDRREEVRSEIAALRDDRCRLIETS